MKVYTVIKHMIIFVVILSALLAVYYFGAWRSVSAERIKVEITATATQNTIATGVSAVSIVLPLTVGILGFTMKERKIEPELLFCACIFLTISLFVALFNLFRLPGLVNVLNVANDTPTGILQIIQLFSLFWAIVYLMLGAWRIVKGSDNSRKSKRKTGTSVTK